MMMMMMMTIPNGFVCRGRVVVVVVVEVNLFWPK